MKYKKFTFAFKGLCLFFLFLPGSSLAQNVSLQVTPGRDLLAAGEAHTVYLKISLHGQALEHGTDRTPVNIALVLDRSGSMSGQKIVQARKAAVTALDYLNSEDIVSVIAYDTHVDVLVPATKVSDKGLIAAAINRLQPRSSTALYAGLSKGADEVRKFREDGRVNRVILLSDGLANVGPDSPEELARFGSRLGEEGISVTTLGLGLDYNEDLMSGVARSSDGNHAFVENAKDLQRIFALEFGDVLSVVAQHVEIEVECVAGVRPIRVLGRDAQIDGQRVKLRMNQLYANQEKYVLLALQIPAGSTGTFKELGNIRVNYTDMAHQNKTTLRADSRVKFSDSKEALEKAVNTAVQIAVSEQIGLEKNKEALKLRDNGQIKEAEDMLKSNAAYLSSQARKYSSARLAEQSESNAEAADSVSVPQAWNRQRKQMRKEQHEIQTQQAY